MRHLQLFLFVTLVPAAAAAQTTFTVATEAALRTAITSAGAGDRIVLGANITLTSGDLPSVHSNITFDGGGHTLSGNNQFRGLLVAAFTGGAAAAPTQAPVSVTIQNLTIADTLAQGGNGGSGSAGGGGGAGMGGGLFVASQANVTLSNVNFTANRAAGGTGGVGVAGAPAGGGGGGGLGGNGGDAGRAFGGGGGGAGSGATGGSGTAGGPGVLVGASNGGASGAIPGGVQGGGGGSSGQGSGGGGNGAGSGVSGTAGAGGYGGGGAGAGGSGAAGGFGGGGGGGGPVGFGGYGGGGGGDDRAAGTVPGGFAGGDGGGSGAPGGGGGGGLGGGIFVEDGGTITVSGSVTVNGNTVAGGAGAGGGGNGSGFGGGMFFGGTGTVVFSSAVGQTQTIADTIGDELGSSGIAGFGSVSLNKTGAGTLVLAGANQYAGGTVIDGGTVQVSNAGNLGTGAVTMHNSSTLAVTGGGAFAQNVNLAGTPVVSVAAGQTASFNGTVADDIMVGSGSLTVSGGGTLALGNGANSYSGGTAVIGNSVLVIGSDGALGASGTGVTLGDAATSGTLRYTSGANVTTTRAFTFDGNAGAVDTVGTAAVNITGSTSGSGALIKLGTGTLTLTGASTRTGITVAFEGVLRAGITNAFGSGTVQVGPTGTLDLNNFDQSVGSISGGGLVTLGSATLTTGADNLSTFFGGEISGTGGLVKEGAGVMVLTGANTYSGGTAVNAGALSGTTTSLQGDITNNAIVQFNQAGAGTYAGDMSGSGMLVKSGAGTVTLSGANTYTGGTQITAGTLVGDSTSVQGDILNDAALVFNQGTNGTYAGTIVGSGSLTKSGAGTLTLAGQTLYSGGTTISGGTLAGTTQNLQGSIRNDAALVFDQGFTGLFSGSISGSGSVTKSGLGTLVLDGTNSYTGGTTIAGGTVIGTSASLQGNIRNDAQLIFNQNVNGTYAGTMTGTGSLAKAGAGTLTLGGPNSYAGGTSVFGGGGISIGADAALGAAAGAVSLGDAVSIGTLTFTNGSLLVSARPFSLGAGGGVFDTAGAQVTLFGGVSGSGGLTKSGDGTLTLAGGGSYAGPTTIAGGTLQAGAAGAFGSGNALLVSSGSIADLNGFDQSVSSLSGGGTILLGQGTLTTGTGNAGGAFAGSISGAGSLAKVGSGTLTLTGVNTYTGGTRVSGGALVGTTASLQGNVVNNGLVQFDQNGSGTYAGSMTGSGSLAKTGDGVLTLSGSNSYSGGTIVAGGALVGTTASLGGLIVNNSRLTFGGAADGVFAGMLTGTGSLTKTGTGTLTLNGAQPLSGLFSVSQGTVSLNGLYGGSIDVAAGAALRAGGVIAGSLNLAGSLFAVPASGGAAAGTAALSGDALDGPSYLTIGRDLRATNGSLLDFLVGPGATPTIVVGGTAAIDGARFNITAPSIGNLRSTSFLALASLNGLSLANAEVATADPGVVPLLKQDRNSLFVTLLNLNVPLRTVAGPGTISVAEAIDRTKFDAGGDGMFVIRELTALDDSGLRDALAQIGGQLHASVLHTAILDSESVTDLVRDQLSARELDDGEDFRWWGETACQRADFAASPQSRGGHANVCAGAGGVDRRLSDRWTIGGGGSYTGGSMGLGSMGSGDYTAPRAFGYVGYKPRRFGFRGGGSAAKSSYQTQRQITFQALLPPELGAQPLSGGVDREAQSEQEGATTDSWSELHDSRKVGSYTIEGLIGVRHARISRGSFTEQGALALSLAAEDETLALTQTDVKIHTFRRSGTYRPFFDFNYRRELAEGLTKAAVQFTGLPNSDFIVQGINIPASTYSTRMGMTFATIFGQATLTYEYKRAPGQRRQAGALRFRFK